MSIQPFRLSNGGLIDRSRDIDFDFDGIRLTGYPGDLLASALKANGIQLKPSERCGTSSLIHHCLNGYALPIWLTDGMKAGKRVAQNTFGDNLSSFPSSCSETDTLNLTETSCDIVIVGGGAAGLTAAHVAANMGAEVVLLDQGQQLGGWLLNEHRSIEQKPAQIWIQDYGKLLLKAPNVRVYLKTTAAHVKSGFVLAFSHSTFDPTSRPETAWLKITAKQIILASGASEEHLITAENRKRGTELSSAIRGYLNQYGVICGKRTLVVTNNDSGYLTAFDMVEAGLEIAGIVDKRVSARSLIQEKAEDLQIPVFCGANVKRIRAGSAVEAVEIVKNDGTVSTFLCDNVAMAGGLVPVLDVLDNSGIQRDKIAETFLHDTVCLAGSSGGAFALQACMSSAAKAGAHAALSAGYLCQTAWQAPKNIDPLLNLQRVTSPYYKNTCCYGPFAHDLAPSRLPRLNQAMNNHSSVAPNSATFYSAAALGLITRLRNF